MSEAPVVHTASGPVRGVWRDSSAAFLGIPFAQAPVGALRFCAPVPPEPWTEVRDAVEYGATAQRGDPGQTLIPEPSVPGEATLNVNVFTPAPGQDAALPVLVWIHGGGYIAGSPASPWYDGQKFNRDGVVTVTLSYRLGFDGFGLIDGAMSNRGVRDWLAGLEWVQQNIAAFGGDPSRVTIAGQSAGGGAVLTLLGMPQAQHLFHAVWALSPALVNVSVERAGTLSAKLARLAGVPATRDGLASVDEMRLLELREQAEKPASGKPLDGIVELLTDGLSWGPMLDGEVLERPTLEALTAGIGADKPLVIGTTDDEFTMATDSMRAKLRFVPAALALGGLGLRGARRSAYLAANRVRGTAAVVGRFVTDTIFRAPTVRVVQARGDAATWVYRFVWASPTVGWACHCLDVPFWWDWLDSLVGVASLAGANPPRALADALHGAAVSFVRSGEVGWTPWSAHPGTTRLFGAGPSARDVVPDGYAAVEPLVAP
ncbi:carboxylesterase/lipase family protein [Microbacterium protaetiae]|uniref:Carboxylic ester hydrolase n=1 Tax=Microbacterium protaetiae TaxID=2509458 RepID=A0A4P6EAE9_9MICO|nr:carboxylesterase family protein [Microbacterium protaetiae]QAY59055.1 carboxylesterase/lipase family protein [Microbacterium protaetiae]